MDCRCLYVTGNISPEAKVELCRAAEDAGAVGGFIWMTQDGRKLEPMRMETRHLYLSLRMMWNHLAPEGRQLLPFRRYNLGPRFSPEYIHAAVVALGAELAKRPDIEARWRRDLETIALHLVDMERTAPAKLETDGADNTEGSST